MRVVKTRSHKGGEEYLRLHHAAELAEVYAAIIAVDAESCLSLLSKEKTKPPLLFSPVALNHAIKSHLHPLGWAEASSAHASGHREPRLTFNDGAFREMDGIKCRVGIEIQFGKYAFMGYDIFSKMVIFHKQGRIDCGIEVVAMPEVVRQMSSGVSSFNQITLDMDLRGEADLDIPTFVIGIGLTAAEEVTCEAKRKRFAKKRAEMLKSGQVSRGRKGARPGPKGAAGAYQEVESDEEG